MENQGMRRFLYPCVFLCLASCGGIKHPHKTYPVSGQVLVNGQPAKGVEVGLHPQGDMGGNPYFPMALTDEEGKFLLTTYEGDDGAPSGDYQVELTWPTYRKKLGNGPDRLGGKYAKGASSGLKVHIDESAAVNVIPPFDIKADTAIIKAAEAASEKTLSKKGAKKKER
jgi:hypothetical protein